MVLTHDQVSFPMTRYDPILHFLRALMDADHVGDLASLVDGMLAVLSQALFLPQVADQFLAQFPFG